MAFLGCSRGLGQAVTEEMVKQGQIDQALLVSRSQKVLQSLGESLNCNYQTLSWDFAKTSQMSAGLDFLKQHQPKRLFYFAGGGPYGSFVSKQWKDHQWSLQVSFLTPAELLHQILTDSSFQSLRQIVFIGSLVADSQPDPLASSYAASKHALKGLIESIHQEGLEIDVRFFRPGYMDTQLLPPNAHPRQEPGAVASPQKVARSFVSWALDPSGAKSFDYSD